ncbi:Allantoin permease [Penicillium waksmanii]|uniref:Allantoin permease n=1 Tax=Penicillium waksmanii TaxID=69791 RepID=UPI0025493B28|nr:Allantoin permease [Penicillium waksmanii]KAJ5980236.1 Allantoin permease [Penicillium waksmanii]
MRTKAFLQSLRIKDEGGPLPNRWINNDIKPIEAERRTWGFWTFHNFWVLINSNISSYMTGSSLIALGLTWWQAILSIVIGQVIATALVVLNSLPGAYYHLGFPVVNRYVWGMYGSTFVILNRILLSIVWYGFQAWIGGECVYVCLQAIWPDLESRIPNHLSPSTGTTTANFLGYIIFMLISLPIIYVRPHKLKNLFYGSAATILIFELVLLIWSLATMGSGGFGSTISGSSSTNGESSGWIIAFGIISTIGSISAGILNQNDYARFARRPKDAVWGQLISFPFYAITCSVIGILVTAATQERYGGAMWNLPTLLSAVIENGGSRSRAAAFFGGAALVISQIGVNVPGFDMAATFPQYINIRRGAYLTALLSIACNPWKLVNTATTFLAVLSSYSVFLGPMTGLMISSYFVINKRKIKVDDLFVGDSSSIYWYTCGLDWRAAVAWVCGTIPSLPGFVAAAVYCTFHWLFPATAVRDYVATAPPAAVLMREYRERWDSVGTESDQKA